jgi:hypothetical protein
LEGEGREEMGEGGRKRMRYIERVESDRWDRERERLK